MFLLQYVYYIMLTDTTLIKPTSINRNYTIQIYIALKINTLKFLCVIPDSSIRTFSLFFFCHLKCCPASPRLSCWPEALMSPIAEVPFMIFSITENHFKPKTTCSLKGQAPLL